MIKSSFTEYAKKISIKIGIVFSHIPLSPNAWTVISLLPALAGLYFLVSGKLLYAMISFLVAIMMDAIDGGVAKVTGRTTNFGAYLDGMIDRFVEAAIIFGMIIYGIPDFLLPGSIWLVMLLFFGTCMTTFARAYADHRKVVTDRLELEKMGGLFERTERVILILVALILMMFVPIYATYAIILGCALSTITVFQRMFYAYKKR